MARYRRRVASALVICVGNSDDKVETTAVGATLPGSNPQGAREPLLVRGKSLGRYLILDSLGAGGMGQVFSAYDPELNRKVAIKLLRARPGRERSVADDQARLIREGQAMAQLSQPNVVTIYDVGAYQDGFFIAMELVDGKPLNEWMAESRRSWREILETFIQAARGLAAAHAAGIVHRDFKPHNVLVGKDGRVRVTDFGLARASADGPSGPPVSVAVTTGSDSLRTPLTVAGEVMGTPGYMSLEQLRGRGVDARSDQFSFCVALYEALYNERPFPGTSLAELEKRLAQEQVRLPPRGTHVPGWLRKIVLRGLASDPARRFPSVEALLSAVERRRRSARTWMWAAGLAALTLVAVGAWRFASARREARCSGAAHRLDGVWDTGVKSAVHARFDASGSPFAREAWAGTERTLDAWTREWVGMETANCGAQQQDPRSDFLGLQQRCLEDRVGELKALSEMLRTADAKLVRTAVEAASSLTAMSSCNDLRRLRATTPVAGGSLWNDPSLRERLATIKALRYAGRFPDAIKAARAVADSARKTGDHVVLAQSLVETGLAASALGSPKEATDAFDEADLEADAAGLDWLRVEIAAGIAFARYLIDDLAGGRRAVRRAEAILARVGGDDGLQASIDTAKGALAGEEGDLQETLRQATAVVTLRRKIDKGDSLPLLMALRNLAETETEIGHFERALALAEEARDMAVRMWGAEHPRALQMRGAIAHVLLDMGEYQRSLEVAQQWLAAMEQQYGPDNFLVGEATWEIASVLLANGDAKAALEHFRSVERIYRKVWGPGNYYTGEVLAYEGEALHDLGHKAEASSQAKHALDIIVKSVPRKDSPAVALRLLGDLALEDRRFSEARDLFRRAETGLEAALGADSLRLGVPLTGLGEAELGTHNLPAAVAALERAIRLREGHPFPREDDGRTRFALARALWEQGSDRDRALQLAREARQSYLEGATRTKKNATAVEAWLASRK